MILPVRNCAVGPFGGKIRWMNKHYWVLYYDELVEERGFVVADEMDSLSMYHCIKCDSLIDIIGEDRRNIDDMI